MRLHYPDLTLLLPTPISCTPTVEVPAVRKQEVKVTRQVEVPSHQWVEEGRRSRVLGFLFTWKREGMPVSFVRGLRIGAGTHRLSSPHPVSYTAEYTDVEEREVTRPKEVWVKKIVDETVVEKVPVTKRRRVKVRGVSCRWGQVGGSSYRP